VRCGNSLKGDCAGAGVCLSQLVEYILSLLEPNLEVRSGALNFLFISFPSDSGHWSMELASRDASSRSSVRHTIRATSELAPRRSHNWSIASSQEVTTQIDGTRKCLAAEAVSASCGSQSLEAGMS
jgi:hypothetical protein